MSSTQVILLERIDNLGAMGEIVSVKPGFARNYLLPQKKALRASKANLAFFEAQKKSLEAESAKAQKEAEKVAKKLEGLTATLIRQASESGQLFGSVNARDIAKVASEESQETIQKTMVRLNQNIKTIGLFPVEVVLHPEVRAEITINVARSTEEASIQAKTGRALVADSADQQEEAVVAEAPIEAVEEIFEESAIEEMKAEAEAEEKAKEEAEAKAKEKAEKTAAKKAEQAEEEAPIEASSEAAEAEEEDSE